MADSQIFSGAVADAQSVYQLPGAVTFVLKAVNADFADNGAGSAWLPAVVIGSDSGHVIARAVDQAVQVAAGSDAACSFFPGVKHAGGGSGTLLDLPWCFAEGNMRMDGADRSFFDFVTNDASVYDTIAHIATDTVRILEPGTYLVLYFSEWTTVTATPAVGTRVRTNASYVFAGAGGDDRIIHDGNLGVGSQDVSGVATHLVWQTHSIDLVNVQATSPPVQIILGAANTASSNLMSADTALTVVRIAATPFPGSL